MNAYREPDRRVEPPDPPPLPICPSCGAETDTFYRARMGSLGGRNNIIGCDCCIEAVDAWDFAD